MSLPEDERTDLLAFETRRSHMLEDMLTGMQRSIKNGNLIDGGAFASTLLALIGD